MNNKKEILERIKNSIVALEKEDQDEFDLITAVFSISHETTNLLGTMCGGEKIKGWKDGDDPSFYRFASKLKIGLELQRDYLNSISGQLILERDIVSQKITDCQVRINSLLEQEKTILKEVDSLIQKEDELKEKNKRVDALFNKKNELEDIEKKLSGIDLKKLEAKVVKLEKKKTDLENKYRPLLNQKEALQNTITELSAEMQNITGALTRFETAKGEEVQRLTENIPQWIEKIKQRRMAREGKDREYMAKLEEEAGELRETEKMIQEHLNKSKELVALAMDKREILRTHFEANKTIDHRFSRSLSHMSLPQMQGDLSRLTETVEKELVRFDVVLGELHKRIQEIAAEFKPVGIGG